MWRLTFNIIMFIQKIVLLPQRPIWNQNVYSKKHFGAVFQFKSSVKSKLSWRWVFTCIAKGGSSHVLLMVGIRFHCWGWVFTFITEEDFHMYYWGWDFTYIPEGGSSRAYVRAGIYVHPSWGWVLTCIAECGTSHEMRAWGLRAPGLPPVYIYIYIYNLWDG